MMTQTDIEFPIISDDTAERARIKAIRAFRNGQISYDTMMIVRARYLRMTGKTRRWWPDRSQHV